MRRAILKTILYSTIFSVTPRHNFTDRFAHLTLITQELKTRYSPETQKQLLEESSQLLPDFVLQELLKRQEQVVNVNPDTLIVVNCQIAEIESDDLGFDLNVEVYFVIADTTGQNHFQVKAEKTLSAYNWINLYHSRGTMHVLLPCCIAILLLAPHKSIC